MSDRNDNNWNSSNASTESVGNRKTSQNKSLPENKCEDQMQRTDCDIQKDQLVSGTTGTTATTAADTSETVDTPDQISHTNDDNEANGTETATTGTPDETCDSTRDSTRDSTNGSNSGSTSVSPKDMQKQHTTDQIKDLSQSSNDDDNTNSQTTRRTQSKSNKSLGSTNDKSKNDFNANDNLNHKTMSEKKVQEESDVRTDEYKCPVCDLKLDSQHTFTVHIRQHNPSDHSHTCRLCGKTLSSASSLDRHMLIHSGERPFKCRICSMAFTTNGNMHRHMRTHGVENNNDDANGTDSHSHSNRLIKSKKRKVNDDDKEEKTPPKKREPELNGSSLSKKSETIGNGEINCPICKKKMSSKSALHTHMEVHPNDSICCLDCGMIVNNYATYTQHRCTGTTLDGTTQSTSPNRMNFSSAPAVGFYDLSFTDFSSRKFSLIAKSFCEHNLRKASSPYHEFECDKCKRAFPCGSALNLHQSSHEGQTYCQLCRHDFDTPALYMAHQIKHRFDYPMPMTGTIPKALDFRIDSSEVQKASYGDVPQSDKEDFLALLDLQNKGSQLNSVHSNYKFTRSEDPFENSSYYIHAQPIPPRPTAFQPKVIASGNETDSNKHDLADIQSILSVTSSANPMMSGIRSSPPAASPASPVHLGTSGTHPDSPVAADSANASPNTPSVNSCKTEVDEKANDTIESNDKSLSIVTEAEDELIPTFKCNKCSLKFKSQNALKRHNRGHTQGGHSYACHLCTYTSLDKSTLVRHLRTHNGERPFQCAICKYAFTTKANCERHVKKRHKKLQKNEIRSAMQYNPNMSTTSSLTQQNLAKPEANLSLSPNSDSFPGGFDTVCKYCNVDFKFNRVLRHHLRSLHNSCSRKPFCCTVCKLGFSTKNNCIRHVVKQHPEMKDKLSSVVLSNASMIGLSSDQSESESLYHDSTKDSMNMSNDNSMNGFSGQQLMTGTQPTSSLAALCQIAKSISANNDMPMNLAIDSKSNDEDDDTECSGCEDQPLNLASHSHEEQPLDLAVHALDLSCKPFQGIKEKPNEDMKQVNEAVRTAASSLLALRSMTATNVFPQNNLLSNTLQPTLFHPAIPLPSSLTPPLPAHSSSSMSMLSPNTNSSMDDIYKVTTFRISKNRLLPRNERSFTCVYCSAGFTLKSNMERHIKRKHPEFARPPRSRGMSAAANHNNSSPGSVNSSANTSLLSKCNNPTLSSKTRAALRVVLSNKVMGSTSGPNSRPSSPMDSSVTNLSIKVTEDSNNNSDQNGDLASVSSLIDHSANSSNALKQYFNNKNEELDSNGAQSENASNSDTEPIRPSSHKSETSNGNSAKEDNDKALNATSVKKRSAYTDSPNSVSCPYCARKFPWTSSLRRHILTHTGLKPYKCPKCPILFTTKSNCERHLIRKHNGREKRIVESSVFGQDSKPYKCNVCPNSTFTTQGNLRKHYYLRHWTKTGKSHGLKAKKEGKPEEELNQMNPTEVHEEEEVDDEEGTNRLHFKCYVCEAPFTGRLKCLKHIQSCHSSEYHTLQSKGAVDKVPTTQTRLMLDNHNDEYEAYGPEKISCVFCPRHFTLFDNLRRHMRVHLGERPFRCTLCPKKFSLKNSLLRHHRTNHPESVLSTRVKGKSKDIIIPSVSSASSFIKDTENSVTSKPVKSKTSCNSLLYLIPNEGAKVSEKFAQNDDFSDADNGQGSDLIQNLLGLQDSKILDDLLDSGADSAARILGVKDLA